MFWTVIVIVVVSALKLLITCLPNTVVEWLHGKFKLHPTLSIDSAIVKRNGSTIEGEEKAQIIEAFNKATFLDQYYVHDGNRTHYLNLERNKTPIIIHSVNGKHTFELLIYGYSDHVDVVKKSKKKVLAYRMLSDEFQTNMHVS
ncbi:YfmQ family protein [Priestia flexa]|uniref:YfmQ n=2 Tax=Priestia TaxID=2800373 RepID=A0A0V8JMW6_9BACI|nr:MULTISPECIES: YfmQ family protein [Bacillaceae]AQX56080.1 hypothetical protein BC359_18490 [Priestia flexa]KSU88312.1 hypothetical protein AS180_08475 [Priestia veravalensis]KZB90365.1 hypothetical protein A2U94_16570 [Bacillus sp. VT 712]MBY6087836.1 YfmQ family protein [Priestia flexa]MCA1202810.1 YfmQ family protein [Priestia flexa]